MGRLADPIRATVAAVREALANEGIRRLELIWSIGIAADAALLVVLLVLGALNRRRLVPAVTRASANASSALGQFARLRKNMVSEIAILVALAAAVALLTDLPPPS